MSSGVIYLSKFSPQEAKKIFGKDNFSFGCVPFEMSLRHPTGMSERHLNL